MNERILKDFKSTRLLHIRRREKIGEQIIQGKNNGKEIDKARYKYLVKTLNLENFAIESISSNIRRANNGLAI
jgi:hypothetical protein